MATRTEESRAPASAATAGEDFRAEELVRLAAAGDAMAFERLVDRFQGEVFRMVYYRVQSRMEAEDLTQEIFIRAFRSLSALKEPGHFRTWLFRIAVNRIRDFHRKKRILVFLGLGSDLIEAQEGRGDPLPVAPDGLDRLLRQEFWNHFRRFADGLSPGEREVFVLRFMSHLTIKEIAGVLGKSESSVKTHLYRGVRKFKGSPDLLRLLGREDL